MALLISSLKSVVFDESKSPVNKSSETPLGEEALHGGPQVQDAGELNFEEYTRGGLGRHLGVFSTTFLMLASNECF